MFLCALAVIILYLQALGVESTVLVLVSVSNRTPYFPMILDSRLALQMSEIKKEEVS